MWQFTEIAEVHIPVKTQLFTLEKSSGTVMICHATYVGTPLLLPQAQRVHLIWRV